MITTNYLITEQDADAKVQKTTLDGINKTSADAKPTVVKSSKIGPTIAKDIVTGAYWSVILSLIVIFLYILIRFQNWQYSLGAVTSLLFNVFCVLGAFSIFGVLDILPFSVELDQAFIAAILTVVGYDIHDTVITYDRIREIRRNNIGKKVDLTEVFNTGIQQTISRTVVTSFTAILSALILFLFGGEVLQPFMFSLLIGFTVGVFTSIFIASPISLDLILRSVENEEASHQITSTKK